MDMLQFPRDCVVVVFVMLQGLVIACYCVGAATFALAADMYVLVNVMIVLFLSICKCRNVSSVIYVS